jgi:hypothetical protein
MKCKRCLLLLEEETEMAIKPVFAKENLLLGYLFYYISLFLMILATILHFKMFISFSLYWLNIASGFFVMYKRKDYLQEGLRFTERTIIGYKYYCRTCGNEHKFLKPIGSSYE